MSSAHVDLLPKSKHIKGRVGASLAIAETSALPLVGSCVVPTLSDTEFARCVELALEWTGVRLRDNKRSMLVARLGTRLRQLKLTSIASYLRYLESSQGQLEEKEHFIDVVTTHHTALFRENEHFTVLAKMVVPSLLGREPIRVLSAACSTGEEIWSIGITLAEALGHLRFELQGTDISHRAILAARRAVYSSDTLVAVPDSIVCRWFMRSRDPNDRLVRVVPELRQRAVFSLANLTERVPTLGGSYDVVFLRNALIYFDRAAQGRILRRVLEHLTPNGWLFVGLSESAEGFDLPLQRTTHSVYRRAG
jgi:chemotaxis protein methyltransferase CheR